MKADSLYIKGHMSEEGSVCLLQDVQTVGRRLLRSQEPLVNRLHVMRSPCPYIMMESPFEASPLHNFNPHTHCESLVTTHTPLVLSSLVGLH